MHRGFCSGLGLNSFRKIDNQAKNTRNRQLHSMQSSGLCFLSFCCSFSCFSNQSVSLSLVFSGFSFPLVVILCFSTCAFSLSRRNGMLCHTAVFNLFWLFSLLLRSVHSLHHHDQPYESQAISAVSLLSFFILDSVLILIVCASLCFFA